MCLEYLSSQFNHICLLHFSLPEIFNTVVGRYILGKSEDLLDERIINVTLKSFPNTTGCWHLVLVGPRWDSWVEGLSEPSQKSSYLVFLAAQCGLWGNIIPVILQMFLFTVFPRTVLGLGQTWVEITVRLSNGKWALGKVGRGTRQGPRGGRSALQPLEVTALVTRKLFLTLPFVATDWSA